MNVTEIVKKKNRSHNTYTSTRVSIDRSMGSQVKWVERGNKQIAGTRLCEKIPTSNDGNIWCSLLFFFKLISQWQAITPSRRLHIYQSRWVWMQVWSPPPQCHQNVAYKNEDEKTIAHADDDDDDIIDSRVKIKHGHIVQTYVLSSHFVWWHSCSNVLLLLFFFFTLVLNDTIWPEWLHSQFTPIEIKFSRWMSLLLFFTRAPSLTSQVLHRTDMQIQI